METNDFSLYDDYDVNKIFGENHKSITSFLNLQNAVKFGKVSFEFIYSPKVTREFLSDQNSGFYKLMRNLKNFGSIAYILYMLVIQQYNFLWIIPILYLIRHVIHFLWYKKLITTLSLSFTAVIICYFLKLEINYSIFLVSFIILQSITFSAYTSFMEQYFLVDEVRLSYALEKKLIKRIYDGFNKRIIEI